jgi:hypothetical protein
VHLILNIGLVASKAIAEPKLVAVRRGQVLDWISRHFKAAYIETHQSATEPTFVVEGLTQPAGSAGSIRDHIEALAMIAEQDCIAVKLLSTWDPRVGVPKTGLKGKLIGPRADLWEPFSEAHFIYPTRRVFP